MTATLSTTFKIGVDEGGVLRSFGKACEALIEKSISDGTKWFRHRQTLADNAQWTVYDWARDGDCELIAIYITSGTGSLQMVAEVDAPTGAADDTPVGNERWFLLPTLTNLAPYVMSGRGCNYWDNAAVTTDALTAGEPDVWDVSTTLVAGKVYELRVRNKSGEDVPFEYVIVG